MCNYFGSYFTKMCKILCLSLFLGISLNLNSNLTQRSKSHFSPCSRRYQPPKVPPCTSRWIQPNGVHSIAVRGSIRTESVGRGSVIHPFWDWRSMVWGNGVSSAGTGIIPRHRHEGHRGAASDLARLAGCGSTERGLLSWNRSIFPFFFPFRPDLSWKGSDFLPLWRIEWSGCPYREEWGVVSLIPDRIHLHAAGCLRIQVEQRLPGLHLDRTIKALYRLKGDMTHPCVVRLEPVSE